MKKKIIIIVLIAVILFLIVFPNLAKSNKKCESENRGYKDINEVEINNRVYFSDFEDKNCDFNDSYDKVCNKELGVITMNNETFLIKVESIFYKVKIDNSIYINDEKIKIDKKYKLNYIEPIKYKEEAIDTNIFFLSVIDENNLKSTFLIDTKGNIVKELTKKYNNIEYETEILDDGNIYIFYNTCEDTLFKRHKLNINTFDDSIIYDDKVISCN